MDDDLDTRRKALFARFCDESAWTPFDCGDGNFGFGMDVGEYGVCVYYLKELRAYGWTLRSAAEPVVDGSGGAWIHTLAEAKIRAFDESAMIILTCDGGAPISDHDDLDTRRKALFARFCDESAWTPFDCGDGNFGFGMDVGEYGVCVYYLKELRAYGWTLRSAAEPVVDGSGGAWIHTLAEAKIRGFDESAMIILTCDGGAPISDEMSDERISVSKRKE